MSTKKNNTPIDGRESIAKILIDRTSAMEKKYRDALKPRKEARLTRRAQALQELVRSGEFGCRSEIVAAAFTIITGETILPAPKKPEISREDIVAGICIVLKEADSNVYPAGIPIINLESFYRCVRTDTGKVKERGIDKRLEAWRFAKPDEIRKAVAGLPNEVVSLLPMALLK